MKKQEIYVKNLDTFVEFNDQECLLEVLLHNEIDIDHSCGGMGSCGTCRIYVKNQINLLPQRNEIEQERATDLCFDDTERLSCQLPPINGLHIEIPG